MSDMTATEPVNLSKPNWACPVCGTQYHEDLAAAEACVALGAPDGAGAAPEIAVWTHACDRRFGRAADPAALELVTLDKVKLDRDGGGHVLTYSNGQPASIGVGVGAGEIVEVGGEYRATPGTTYGPDGGKGLSEWLNSIGEQVKKLGDPAQVWPYHNKYGYADESDYYGGISMSRPTVGRWFGPLTDDVRLVFETLFTENWERLLAVDGANDVIDRPGHARRGEFEWAGVGTHRRGLGSGFGFCLRDALFSVACAHGFGSWDHIGVTRWLTIYNPNVIAWLHNRFYRWVQGEDVSIPVFTATPSVTNPGYHTGLPKKPNKRRVEALAAWGINPDEWNWYSKVTDTALATLRTEPPINPVPGVVDALTFRSPS